MMVRPQRALVLFAVCLAGSSLRADVAAQREFFEAKIRPVLAAQCYSCHGATKQQGGLRLDWRDALREGGASGPAVEPGNPDGSLLVEILEDSDAQRRMPRKAAKLPDTVLRDVRAWIAAGAFDPRDKPPSPDESAQAEWQAKLSDRRTWWSLQPVTRPAVPEPRHGDGSANPVDRFILSHLEKAGLVPAGPAPRPVLARRLAFVLTGLPPDPALIDAYTDDPAPAAYEHLVDRLLASPRFGEHFARHWMDVVRYGDTYGYEWDIPAKGAWRYRDFLVRAYNADVPFDVLAREQLAGDLLAGPRLDPVAGLNESLAGPMFYQLGEKRHGDSAMFDGIHQEMLHNKIDALSKAFQGLTVGCARCHDHKLDAVSQRDYYALAGALMSARWVTNTLDTPARNAATFAELRRLKQGLRAALAGSWAEASRRGAEELAATRLVKVPESGANPWSRSLAAAGSAPAWEHPLRPWVELVKTDRQGGDVAAAWKDLATRYANEATRRKEANAKTFRVVADFRQAVPAGWSVDGAGLRDGPVRSGDFTVALDGTSAVGQILPAGLFTHALSPRLNGAVRTPYLRAFPEARLSLEDCGGDFAAERVVVDNAFLAERQSYLARRDPAWSGFTTGGDLAGRHAYVELATKSSNPNFPPRVGLGGPCSEAQVAESKSWLGVTRVVAHQDPGTPEDELARFAALFSGPAPESLFEAAKRYASWWQAALGRWERDEAADEDVRLLNWLLDQGLLPNRAEMSPSVSDLVEAYRRTERDVLGPQTINGMADLDDGFDYPLNVRGEYSQLGPAVPRGYLEVLASSGSPAPFASPQSGRLDLAERIASSANPLTARVYVNRVWQWVFGTGFVATPDDFGRLGEAPTHPELLDWLASWFVDHGWSTKALVRLLVTSATFRQDSLAAPRAREVDPGNRLLHHYPLRRLEAESVRDAILAVSGRLDGRLYGPPIDPHRPKEDPDKRLVSGPIDGHGRRSLYIKLTIMEPPKFLAAFNQPPPKIPTGRRDVTNVPAQALALLNDPFVLEQAKVWGERLVAQEHGSVRGRLEAMFRTALGRPPTDEELGQWEALVEDLRRERAVSTGELLRSSAVWADVAHTMINTKEFLYVR
jgi:hypothetical protein